MLSLFSELRKRPEGVKIYSVKDSFGVIEVYDNNGERSLHFGNVAKQAAMLPSEPSIIVLEYIRHMLAALLFNQNPKKVLLIGVGGGTLNRFFNDFFPDSEVTSIELRRMVIDVANKFFGLVTKGNKNKFFIGDGKRFLLKTKEKFDLILTDAYLAEGISDSVNDEDYFLLTSRVLSENGVVAMNFWSSADGFYEKILPSFNRQYPRTVSLTGLERGNVILFGMLKEPKFDTDPHIIAENLTNQCLISEVSFRQLLNSIIIENAYP